MRARHLFVAVASLISLAGCTPPDPETVETAALGQPNGDYPGYEERVVLYATNKARMDPSAEGWASFPAQPPFQWNYDLNRSARAHSIDMRDTPCFQHESCDGTDPFVRIKTFYTASWNSMGENISAGVPDAVTAVYNWINEIGAAAGETGHRENIFSSSFTMMGSGYAAGGTKYHNYWTQDFVGVTKPPARPLMTDGIHIRASGTGGKMSFGTTYYDGSSSAAAVAVNVVIDGTCMPLPLTRGTPTRGAYEADITLTDGCHGYYFVSNNGTTTVYPDSGGLQVGVGSAASSCALFAASVPAGSCGAPGTAGSSGGAAGAGGGGTTGAAGASGAAGSTATGRGGSTGAAGSTGAGGTTGAAGSSNGAAGSTSTGRGGSTGVAGASGPAGSNGAAGTTGAAGETGATGNAGAGGHENGGSGGCAVGATPRGFGHGVAPLAFIGLMLVLRRRRAPFSTAEAKREVSDESCRLQEFGTLSLDNSCIRQFPPANCGTGSCP
jgi:uncharacterized protein YkwD